MNKRSNASAMATAVAYPSSGQIFSELSHSATFFDSMPREILVVDATGRIVASNERFKKRFGETLPPTIFELSSSPAEAIRKLITSVLRTGSGKFQISYDSDGLAPIDYDVDGHRLVGNPPLAAFVHKSVARSRFDLWARNSINKEDKNFLGDFDLLNECGSAVLLVDSGGIILKANRSATRLLALSQERLADKHIKDFGLDFVNSIPATVAVTRPDGSSFWSSSLRLPFSHNCEIIVITDTSKEIRRVDELERGYEFYRAFAEQSEYEMARFEMLVPVATDTAKEIIVEEIVRQAILTDHSLPNGAPQGADNRNLTFEKFIGNRSEAKLIAESFIDSGYRMLRKELSEITKLGEENFYSTNIIGTLEDSRLIRFWLTRRDITVRKRAEKAYAIAEDQLRQSQKVEPIGRLAGGIAHDFNNFLAVIMLQIEMIKQELEEEDPLHNRISEIVGVSNKAANTVKQLLAFGRKQTMRPQNINLNAVIKDFITMIRPLIGEDIEMKMDLDEKLGICFVDPNQITQILMNLAINAKDAMADGGVLKIITKNLEIDANTFKHRAQPKGRYIEVAFEDNGCGMTASTRNHIFEPFFTTKEAHKGTGLGLATVYGIVKQSKGFIWVDSKVDQGTTFKVQFPRTDRQESKAVKAVRTASIPRGNETILLVEDEELIRKTSSEVLTSLGYNVLEASNGVDALEAVRNHGRRIHLLLTDVVMPRMNGRDLATKLRKDFPDLKVLFVSGYADDIITRHGILEEDVHFLGKPFSPLSLAKQIRQALGSNNK